MYTHVVTVFGAAGFRIAKVWVESEEEGLAYTDPNSRKFIGFDAVVLSLSSWDLYQKIERDIKLRAWNVMYGKNLIYEGMEYIE